MITTEQLSLIRQIVITAVIPSVLWIIRYPLRELIKLLIRLVVGEMYLERFGDFKSIDSRTITPKREREFDEDNQSFDIKLQTPLTLLVFKNIK